MSETRSTKLKPDIVTAVDAAAQSFGFVGPVVMMAFLTSLVAMGAGMATPLAVLLGGLASIAVGYVVAQFAIRHRAAGSIYSYVAQTFGPTYGFLGGWIYMGAVLMLTVAIIAGAAGWTAGFLAEFGINVHWFVILLVEVAILFGLTFFDIRLSTRAQLTIVTISVLIVLSLAITIIVRVGAAGGLTLAPFLPSSAPSFQGLAWGLVYGLLLYTGYESAAVLAEEARHPKRTIPLAILGSATLATVFYTIVTYAYAVGFGPGGAEAWAGDPAVLLTMAGQYGGAWLVPIVFAAAVVDGFAVAMACLNTVARVVFAMGRDGALPRVFGQTHRKYQTPHIANAAVLALSVLVGLAFIWVEGGYEIEFALLAGIGGVSVEIIYILVAVAGLVYFRRVMGTNWSLLKHGVIPAIAVIGPALALYGSIQPQGGILNVIPYVALGWILIGIAVIAFLRNSNPALVAKLGADLGVEEVSAPGAASALVGGAAPIALTPGGALD
jgi:amino acid transporter